MHRKIFNVAIFVCLVFLTVSVSAQQALPVEDQFIAPAILVRGPVASMGFPLIYPNAIEVWLGYYRYLGEEIVVSFTRKNILVSEEWENKVCGQLKGYTLENNSFFYRNDSWTILFQFSGGNSVDCSFINTFIVRLKYFLRDVSTDNPPLLPAILEIR